MHIDDEEKLYKFEYNIQTKNYFDDKSNSARLRGILQFLADSNGHILSWKINFLEVWMDIYTTQSWIRKLNSNFLVRKELFEYIFDDKIIQEPRPNLSANKLILLNDMEIKKLNEWFSLNYKSTLKNIIAIIKGNNPGGSFTSPNNAEIVITNVDSFYKGNLIMFIDKIINLSTKNAYKNFLNSNLNNFWNNQLSKINYLEYLSERNPLLFYFLKILCTNIKNLRDLLQKKNDTQKCLENIESKMNEYFDFANVANRKLNNARNSLPPLEDIIVFEGTQHLFTHFDKAHIYPFSQIKNDTLKLLADKCLDHCKINQNFDSKQINEIVNNGIYQIKSVDNLLNLPKNIHNIFDKNYFTYNQNGEIIYREKKIIKPFELSTIEKYFSKIPYQKLSDLRKYFILQRNKLLEANK